MYNHEDEEEDGPKSTFETYLAEGEMLSNKAYYQKALEAITMVRQWIWVPL
jgi:hypothetical protein